MVKFKESIPVHWHPCYENPDDSPERLAVFYQLEHYIDTEVVPHLENSLEVQLLQDVVYDLENFESYDPSERPELLASLKMDWLDPKYQQVLIDSVKLAVLVQIQNGTYPKDYDSTRDDLTQTGESYDLYQTYYSAQVTLNEQGHTNLAGQIRQLRRILGPLDIESKEHYLK